jgi:beta-phosphoglucomutase family hydrolase
MLITAEKYDAVLFDMDGVLTMTMTIHAACWKSMFDEYLLQRAKSHAEAFRPFEVASDYKAYVDGKLRYDGVQAFLTSRGIDLPYGRPEDEPTRDTVCGLGNRKDLMVKESITSGGVELLDGALDLVQAVSNAGIKTAVVSASKNCGMILKAAGIEDLFDCIVDGTVAAEHSLPGKPAPDTYLEAARELAVAPERSVVVEDAISGVAAGRSGGFGLVIGIDHHGDREALREHGADIVVESLRELLSSP